MSRRRAHDDDDNYGKCNNMNLLRFYPYSTEKIKCANFQNGDKSVVVCQLPKTKKLRIGLNLSSFEWVKRVQAAWNRISRALYRYWKQIWARSGTKFCESCLTVQ